MAGVRLDSAGQAKIKTLDEALLLLQRIHGLVEAYAMALKRNQATSALVQNIRRQLPTLAANTKNQFGLISDQVTAVALAASRGASEQVRLRSLREGVAQVRTALELAIIQTNARHKYVEKPAAEEDEAKGQTSPPSADRADAE